MEFDRLRKLGVKFSFRTLRYLDLYILAHSTNPDYSVNKIPSGSNKRMHELVTPRFTQNFAKRFNIVSRSLTGKKQRSPEKTIKLERKVAFHLGFLCRGFQSGEFQEDDFENADKTHFVFDFDNGRTLGFAGEDDIKYAEAVSGGDRFTMIVRISGGKYANIEAPFVIFKNERRSYPIRGVPDNVPGVSYRTAPKAFIDHICAPEWLSERRAIKPLPDGRRRKLWLDNCAGHAQTETLRQAAERIRTDICYFDPNLTEYVQPCDAFPIQKLKEEWKSRWERHKMKMLAAECVRAVNRQRDSDGINFSRKALIKTGMALNTNGRWEIRQLFPKLQNIVSAHREYFDGKKVF